MEPLVRVPYIPPYAQSVVNEHFNSNPAFALSVAQNATTDELQEQLETNVDGVEYNNDPTLTPLAISNLGVRGNPSRYNAVFYQALEGYVYNREDDVSNSEHHGYTDMEPDMDDSGINGPNKVGPYMYRQSGAMSSTSSLATAPANESKYKSNSLGPPHPLEYTIYDAQNVPTSPESLIGPSFCIVDSD